MVTPRGAAQLVAQDAARNAMSHGLKDVVIRVSGPGLGRDSAIRALCNSLPCRTKGIPYRQPPPSLACAEGCEAALRRRYEITGCRAKVCVRVVSMCMRARVCARAL